MPMSRSKKLKISSAGPRSHQGHDSVRKKLTQEIPTLNLMLRKRFWKEKTCLNHTGNQWINIPLILPTLPHVNSTLSCIKVYYLKSYLSILRAKLGTVEKKNSMKA